MSVAAQTISPDGVFNDLELAYLTKRLRENLRWDLSLYRAEQVKRRLSGMAEVGRSRNLIELANQLTTDAAAMKRFQNNFTIHVTEFFRDPAIFKRMTEIALPQLATLGRPVDVWSAGCSYGAEAMSLALSFGTVGVRWFKVLATDIDPATVERARAGGPFDERDLTNLTVDQKSLHMSKQSNGWFITSPIRNRIEYRTQDLLADPAPGQFDLIACRNVLIYFNDEAKTRVIEKMARALRPGGFLFLGATEIITQPEPLGLVRRAPSLYEKVA